MRLRFDSNHTKPNRLALTLRVFQRAFSASRFVLKGFDRGVNSRPTYLKSSHFSLPAQTVDATPSSALIQQCFPGRADLFGCTRSKPSQCSVPADLTLARGVSLCFHCKLGPCSVLRRPIATTRLIGG